MIMIEMRELVECVSNKRGSLIGKASISGAPIL